MDGDVATLKSMIERAARIVVFSGAGISTESGIPDYRSPGTGTWSTLWPVLTPLPCRRSASRHSPHG